MRVLIVFDGVIVAGCMERLLLDEGCEVVGPLHDPPDAMRFLDRVDGLIVDYDLGCTKRLIAEAKRRGIFIAKIVYSLPAFQPQYQACHLILKPIVPIEIRTMIRHWKDLLPVRTMGVLHSSNNNIAAEGNS